MNSRDKILQSIDVARVPRVPLLPVSRSAPQSANLDAFIDRARLNGSDAILINSQSEIAEVLKRTFPGLKFHSSFIGCDYQITAYTSIDKISCIDVAVLRAEFGVVENGAVLLTSENMIHPAVAFLCEHLVVVMSVKELVSTMHEACQISRHEIKQYAVFVSGPSKTADIEQSLVIGAHGPKTFTIVLTQ